MNKMGAKGDMRLKKVSKDDCPFLYDLLLQRSPTVNISHRKMLTYDEHVKFVTSRPYSRWFLM